MSWPRRAAARASVGLSRGSAATEKDEGAGAGAASTGALAAAADMSTTLPECRSVSSSPHTSSGHCDLPSHACHSDVTGSQGQARASWYMIARQLGM